MSEETPEPAATHKLVGLAFAGALTAGCAVIWHESAWIAERIGLPELRILLAMMGGFLTLSLAHQVAGFWRQ